MTGVLVRGRQVNENVGIPTDSITHALIYGRLVLESVGAPFDVITHSAPTSTVPLPRPPYYVTVQVLTQPSVLSVSTSNPRALPVLAVQALVAGPVQPTVIAAIVQPVIQSSVRLVIATTTVVVQPSVQAAAVVVPLQAAVRSVSVDKSTSQPPILRITIE